MPKSLPALENRRSAIFRQRLALGDFRQGSITTTQGPCGKPSCRCHQSGHPGHGPHWRLTYKSYGKTVTQSLSDLLPRTFGTKHQSTCGCRTGWTSGPLCYKWMGGANSRSGRAPTSRSTV